MSNTIIKFIATFFYMGYIPIASGTATSLGALGLYYFVKGNLPLHAVLIVVLLILGFLLSGRAERIFQEKDAHQITIDEAAGMLIALFLIPQELPYIASAFILFRLFDILKVPPLKRIEKLPGSAGVMLDDIVAAIYANVLVQIVYLTF